MLWEVVYKLKYEFNQLTPTALPESSKVIIWNYHAAIIECILTILVPLSQTPTVSQLHKTMQSLQCI